MVDFLWLGFSLLPIFFAAYFGYMFYNDKDKRKLMFALSFAFASISLIEKIIPSTGIPFIQELYESGGFPVIFAILIAGISGLTNYKSFDKLFQAFLCASILTVVASIFLLFDYPSIRMGSMIGLTFLTLSILVIVLLRKRKTGDLLFLLSIAAFAAAGFGPRLGFGTEFFLLCQGLAYVFIILVFILPTHDTQWSNASFFKVQHQLAETKEQLENLEQKYKIIFEAVGDAIFVADIETGLIVDCNLEATKLVLRDRADIIGKHQSILHPKQESDGTFSRIFQEHVHGNAEFIETKIITSNLELRDVAIKAGVFELKGKKLMVGIFRDVTAQKQNQKDLALALESLSFTIEKIQALNEKLRVVGSLTRHDVRNKLSTVTGYAYLLKKKHPDQVDVIEGLGKIELAVSESMKIFEFAKMYEQLGAEELTYIDVEAKFNEAVALFSSSLSKVINECQGLTVLADSFLRQMFYNFVDNTRKYGQKTTIIKVQYQQTDQGNLVLTYEDDGIGISAENKLKLFSEGFSTGGSTGFGLFLTKKMIDIYGWNITEVGEPGKGVRFVITIPKHNKDGKENYQIVP
jgi:PAS domain S-box-containing protein